MPQRAFPLNGIPAHPKVAPRHAKLNAGGSFMGNGSFLFVIGSGVIGLIFVVLKGVAANKIKERATGSRLIFLIGKTENLDATFGRGPGTRILAPDGSDVVHLNKCNIGCTNVGALAIRELKFDVVCGGSRKYLSVEFKGDARGVASGAAYVPLQEAEGVRISLPFLNPKESLPISIWFDGSPDKCSLECRLEGVNCTVKQANSAMDDYLREAGHLLAAAAPAALLGILESIVNRGDTSSGSSDG